MREDARRRRERTEWARNAPVRLTLSEIRDRNAMGEIPIGGRPLRQPAPGVISANFNHDNRRRHVVLADDGTLDTVLVIDGLHFRIDQETASDYRRRDGTFSRKGLIDLAIETFDSQVPVEEQEAEAEEEEDIHNIIDVLVTEYGYDSVGLTDMNREELTGIIKKEERFAKRRQKWQRSNRKKAAKLPQVKAIVGGRVVFKGEKR